MGDLLSTSVSGLLAFQQALDVTSNNVANAATPGYNAESANFAERPGQAMANGYIGGGVDVASITRAYNALLAQQVNASQGSYSSFNTLASQAAQVDNMLSDSSTGLTATLQSFVNSLQTLSTSPNSTASGQAVLSQAQALVQQLTSYGSQVSQAGSQVESEIGSSVTQINTLAGEIAALNGQVANGLAASGQTPNQLMDQRDQLINQLSQYVGISTTAESNGAVDVYIGTGQALVTGSTAAKLTTLQNAYDASVSDIGLTSGKSTVDITGQITGGSLGGLLAARSQVLDPAQNALGQLSAALTTLMNQQQQSGMDATGAAGKPMFALGGVQVSGNVNNGGSASLAVGRTDLASLTTDDYILSYTGGAANGGWQLEDQTTGQPVAMTGTGVAGDPLQAAGISIVASGTPAAGDSFLIQPTAGATAGLSLLLKSPAQIASASLVQASPASGNTGTGTIGSAAVTDPSTWMPGSIYTVSFTSPTQYQVFSGSPPSGPAVTSGTYTSGQPISFAGEQLTLTGAPAAGDTFTVQPNNAANTGDNSNLLAMVSVLAASTMNGGTTSLSGAANGLVSRIGTLTQQAQSDASAQQSVNQSATDSLNNADGVNLDQEAALMVQYQQAYQACAQMIQASNQMFNSLMQAVTSG
ncbi:MAG: flagellar hook-associated protein FlgK [Steroidobacteraceae bacterium]